MVRVSRRVDDPPYVQARVCTEGVRRQARSRRQPSALHSTSAPRADAAPTPKGRTDRFLHRPRVTPRTGYNRGGPPTFPPPFSRMGQCSLTSPPGQTRTSPRAHVRGLAPHARAPTTRRPNAPRRGWLEISASLSAISRTLNSLFRVLFTFPSRYLFAIGLSPVSSFRSVLPPA